MSYFSSNIKLLRKRKNRSQEAVSGALDLKRPTYSGYENGVAEPGYDTLSRISDYYQVSIDKLLKYDLSGIPESQLSELEKGYDIDLDGNKMRVLATTVNSDNEENIELVKHEAKAGYRTGYADPDYIKVLPTFQLPFLSRNKKYRTFPISGDSMPPVSEGSYVTGEYVQNWKTIKDGYPYIILTKDDGIVFKVVYNQLDDKQNLLLCSTNPAYDPYEVDAKQIMEVWKFVNYISPQLATPDLSNEELTETVLGLQREVSKLKNVLRK